MTSRLADLWNRLTGGAPVARKPPVFGGAAAADAPPPPEPFRPPERKPGTAKLKFAANAELEARLDGGSGDEAAWAIYADWLQTAGDGRGELIALMAQGLDAEAFAWIQRHHQALFGPAARSTRLLPFARYRAPGQPAEPIRVQRSEPAFAPDLIRDVQWDHGFVASASFDPEAEDSLVRAFLALPICRFVRAVGFGAAPHEPGSFHPWMDAVREAGGPSLKRLVLGDFIYPEECEMSWAQLGDVSPVWGLTRLDALTICGGGASLGPVDGRHLAEFSRESGSLMRDELQALLTPAWPRLKRFELWTGSEEYGGDCTLADLRPLLTGEKFPVLTHLALKNSLLADAFVEALAAAPLLKQLTALDLSMGTLGAAGVASFVKHAAAFAHLVHLDVRDNCVPEGSREALRDALPQVVGLDDQDKANDVDADSPDDRYVTVSE